MIPSIGTQTSTNRTSGEAIRTQSVVASSRSTGETSSLTSMAPDLSDKSMFWFCPGLKPIVGFLQDIKKVFVEDLPPDGVALYLFVKIFLYLPFSIFSLITIPVWAPVLLLYGFAKSLYLYAIKQITHIRASNLNEDEKKLIDVAYALRRPFNESLWSHPYNPFWGGGGAGLTDLTLLTDPCKKN